MHVGTFTGTSLQGRYCPWQNPHHPALLSLLRWFSILCADALIFLCFKSTWVLLHTTSDFGSVALLPTLLYPHTSFCPKSFYSIADCQVSLGDHDHRGNVTAMLLWQNEKWQLPSPQRSWSKLGMGHHLQGAIISSKNMKQICRYGSSPQVMQLLTIIWSIHINTKTTYYHISLWNAIIM